MECLCIELYVISSRLTPGHVQSARDATWKGYIKHFFETNRQNHKCNKWQLPCKSMWQTRKKNAVRFLLCGQLCVAITFFTIRFLAKMHKFLAAKAKDSKWSMAESACAFGGIVHARMPRPQCQRESDFNFRKSLSDLKSTANGMHSCARLIYVSLCACSWLMANDHWISARPHDLRVYLPLHTFSNR